MRANSKVLRIWNSRNGERSCWKTRIGAPHWCVSPEMPRATLPPPSAAYKEEHERNFLRSVFRQYKEGYPLDRLFPSRVYRSLQERGVIHHSRAEKLYALSLFKNYRPTSRLYMPEEARGGPPGDHQQQGDGLAPEARVRRHDRTPLRRRGGADGGVRNQLRPHEPCGPTGIYLILLLIGYHATHATFRILHITLIARNQMHMDVKD